MPELSYETPEQWAEIRARHVGSSESAGLGGVTTWVTPFSLYHAKRAGRALVSPDNNRLNAGKRLESAIAAWAADVGNFDLLRSQVYVAHDDVRGMGSTNDYFITDKANPDRGPGILEIKNRDWLQWKQHWTEDRPPADVVWQVQHQLACTKFNWSVTACLVGGNELRLYPGRPVSRAMAKIEELVTDFWSAVDAELEPPVEGWPIELDTLEELYAVVDEGKVVKTDDTAVAENIRLFDWARTESGERKRTAEACKAKLLQVMGDAAVLLAPTVKVRQTIGRNGRRFVITTDLPDHTQQQRSTIEAG